MEEGKGEGQWVAVYGTGELRPSAQGPKIRIAPVAAFVAKRARELPFESVKGLPYMALEMLVDETNKVLDYRPRPLSPGVVRMFMQPLAVKARPKTDGVTKKARVPRVSTKGANYSFFTELPIEVRLKFPQLKWGFAPWSDAIRLFRYYPVELLQMLHISQITKMLQTTDSTIHLWAAMKGMPYVMQAWSKGPHEDDADVFIALGVWQSMIQAYLERGLRGCGPAVYGSLLGSPWGVVTPEGDFARWAAEEAAFRAELPTRAKVYRCQNAFTLEWLAFINTICTGATVVCPGKHFCNWIRRSRGLSNTTRLCTWSNVPRDCGHLVVVLAEYATLAEWRRLFKSSSGDLSLIGDPAHELRLIERGSPFDGFKIACDILGDDNVQSPQELTWPLQHADGAGEWRSLAWRFLVLEERCKPRQLAWTAGAEPILKFLDEGKIPAHHAVLSAVPSVTRRLNSEVRGGGAPAHYAQRKCHGTVEPPVATSHGGHGGIGRHGTHARLRRSHSSGQHWYRSRFLGASGGATLHYCQARRRAQFAPGLYAPLRNKGHDCGDGVGIECFFFLYVIHNGVQGRAFLNIPRCQCDFRRQLFPGKDQPDRTIGVVELPSDGRNNITTCLCLHTRQDAMLIGELVAVEPHDPCRYTDYRCVVVHS